MVSLLSLHCDHHEDEDHDDHADYNDDYVDHGDYVGGNRGVVMLKLLFLHCDEEGAETETQISIQRSSGWATN